MNQSTESTKPFKVFISVGEESADLHAARLCEELKARQPDIDLFGFGGVHMQKAGVRILYPLPELALIGFVEVIKKIPTVQKVKYLAVKIWETEKPDAAIFVDFPGLHLRLARLAQEHHIPVIYYIAPQVWAWHESRVKSMREFLRLLLVIFPFEEPFFRERGIPTHYVGHPLVERIPTVNSGEPSTIPDPPIIGLLPGSRRNELKHHLPTMIRAAELVRRRLPTTAFLLPLAAALPMDVLLKYHVPAWIEVCRDTDYQQRKRITFAWTASGTATVENALLGIPMAVVFRSGPINIFLGRRLVRVPYIGMVNLIAQKGICPEFVQEQFHPETLARTALEVLASPERYQEMKADLSVVRRRIGVMKASHIAGQYIMVFLEENRKTKLEESPA